MRDFHEIQTEHGLQGFLASEMGSLYFRPGATFDDRLMVRHFDGAIAPELTASYADLVHAVENWVMTRPDVARWVRVEVPVEVGHDFIARPHPIYYTSTASYGEADAPPAPPQLEQMRAVVRRALATGDERADPQVSEVLHRVVTTSLLEPTGRTYYDDVADEFVVVEPKIDERDAREWHALGG